MQTDFAWADVDAMLYLDYGRKDGWTPNMYGSSAESVCHRIPEASQFHCEETQSWRASHCPGVPSVAGA